ncbi:uncharacterized protein VNE69_03329 [Vairimorpha necatrix]|uniref:Uncharacterized protein n=1 Tax=Vairimorpha necatrix TaxID=6039 RepID=A0AAX4JAV6_9MICR
MFFYFLKISCSSLEDINNKKHVQISEVKTHEQDFLRIDTVAAPISHKRSIEGYTNYNEKVEDNHVKQPSQIRYCPYKRNVATTNSSNKANSVMHPLDLSLSSSITRNAPPVPNNIYLIIAQNTAHYIHLNYKLKACIFNWSFEDSKSKKSYSALKFKDPEVKKKYASRRARVYSWVNSHDFIVNDLLVRLKQHILFAKIDEKLKYLLFVQLQFFYEAMAYIHVLLPFKKHFLFLSHELKEKYANLMYRIPIVFYWFNLVGIFNDFEKTFIAHYNKQDPVCLEIMKLLTRLNLIFYNNINGLDKFISNINKLKGMIDKAI